jgi:hypothetical protein
MQHGFSLMRFDVGHSGPLGQSINLNGIDEQGQYGVRMRNGDASIAGADGSTAAERSSLSMMLLIR